MKKALALLFIVFLTGCNLSPDEVNAQSGVPLPEKPVFPGIYAIPEINGFLEGKRVGVVSNHTGVIEGVHLVDTLLASGIGVVKVFAPEHGFRGDHPDGAKVRDTKDPVTGLPIVSLYGSNKKPTPEQMEGLEAMVFDIQDVGARFYTYISTLHYAMEACAEKGIPIYVLDRPNPNIHYIDGPVLDPEFQSFVGMHPVPVVYGMTIGEYALMINGEGWLDKGQKADLTVIPCLGYSRSVQYELSVRPSPNLPTMEAVYLYPSLCFFEGTIVSVGRGTKEPFTIIGEPSNRGGEFEFVPTSMPGASTDPKHQDKRCIGYDLSNYIARPDLLNQLQLQWLYRMYSETGKKENFFNSNLYFDKLAGTDQLRKAIINGVSEEEIRKSWEEDLKRFLLIRALYLIYD